MVFFRKVFKEKLICGKQPRFLVNTSRGLVVGRNVYMPEFMWQWTDGPMKVVTTKIEVAEKALRAGFLVIGVSVPQPEPME